MRAMILAAGKGTRLRPLTDHTPKPLLTVQGKPLIVHHIERLVASGVKEIVINTSYLGEQISDYLKDGGRFGACIQYSREENGPLETAGGILAALPLLGNERFIVVNGDVWTDYPFERLKQRLCGDYQAHLVLISNPSYHAEGDFFISHKSFSDNSHRVYAVSNQKNDQKGAGQDYAEENCEGSVSAVDVKHCDSDIKYTFSGISVMVPELFTGFHAGKLALRPVLEAAMVKQRVSGEIYNGIWCDVGTPDRLKGLNQSI